MKDSPYPVQSRPYHYTSLWNAGIHSGGLMSASTDVLCGIVLESIGREIQGLVATDRASIWPLSDCTHCLQPIRWNRNYREWVHGMTEEFEGEPLCEGPSIQNIVRAIKGRATYATPGLRA